MQYASALALASLTGKAPTKESITAILKATGKTVDEAQVDAVLKSLNNRKVDDVISKGLTKVSAGPAPAKKDDKKAEKKVEKKAEKKPEPEPEAVEEEFEIDLFG